MSRRCRHLGRTMYILCVCLSSSNFLLQQVVLDLLEQSWVGDPCSTVVGSTPTIGIRARWSQVILGVAAEVIKIEEGHNQGGCSHM